MPVAPCDHKNLFIFEQIFVLIFAHTALLVQVYLPNPIILFDLSFMHNREIEVSALRRTRNI
jgi:hypothetical protein